MCPTFERRPLQEMQAYQELSQVKPSSDTLFTIGVFDGVHRGHQHLIQQVVAEAKARDCLSGVVTFLNHPRSVLRPEEPVSFLITPEERLRLLKDQGLDLVVPITFDLELSRLRPHEFCGLLQEKLRLQGLVIGPTFVLGFQREGTPEVLQRLGQEMGFTVHVVEPLMEGEELVSSSTLRRALSDGEVSKAGHYLGHPFALEGTVVAGEGRGKGLGFPTANLEIASEIALPADGVYATWAYLEGNGRWKAATNIGVRPTFGPGQRTVEAFLIGFQGDLYRRRVRLEFAHRLREELRFDSPDALIVQMHKDVRQAEEVLGQDEASGA